MRAAFPNSSESTRGPDSDRGEAEHTLEVTWRSSAGPWTVEVGATAFSTRARLEPGGSLVFGSGRSADARIDDRAVSARHCTLSATARGIEVVDAGSKNGVFVGGAKIARATLPCGGGDVVIGHTTISVREDRTGERPELGEQIPGLVGSSLAMQRVS